MLNKKSIKHIISKLLRSTILAALAILLGACVARSIPPTATVIPESPCGTESVVDALIGTDKIAYTATTREGPYAICMMNPDGSGKSTVIHNSRRNLMVDWSPDNRHISFESGIDYEVNVYIADIDRTSEVQLTDSNRALGGSWSPDGQRLVYAEGSFIHVINYDGTNDTITGQIGGNDRPQWSPDGERFVFWSAHEGIGTQIYTMRVDGTNLVRLTSEGTSIDPSWSPDSKRIAFVSDRDYTRPPPPTPDVNGIQPMPITGTPLQGVYQIYAMDVDGSNIEKLTTSGDNFNPSWSPDGHYIAFDRLIGENYQIFVMRADGSNPIQLTFTGNNYKPVWSR